MATRDQQRLSHLCFMLVDARRQRGLTQVELARRLRRPQSFVSKYELGDRPLRVVELLEVTEALGLDPIWVVRNLMRVRRG